MMNTPTAGSKLDLGDNWPYLLVVDDIEDNRNVLRRRLMVAHFRVDEASSGIETLEKLKQRRYAAILLDHMMPEMDGLETLQRIRAQYSKRDLPVIMVTARDEDPLVIRLLEAGANDFVAKPFSFPVLVARVRAQLETVQAA
jgi:DNA-binding response OmpR family regulator